VKRNNFYWNHLIRALQTFLLIANVPLKWSIKGKKYQEKRELLAQESREKERKEGVKVIESASGVFLSQQQEEGRARPPGRRPFPAAAGARQIERGFARTHTRLNPFSSFSRTKSEGNHCLPFFRPKK
jgi:hypothetical protein